MPDSNLKNQKTLKNYEKKICKSCLFKCFKKYDFMNDLMSFGLHRIWKEKLISLLEISKDSLVLDLATGSGDISKKINEKYGCKCIALDANMEMLEIAKKKMTPIHHFIFMVMLKTYPLKIYF